MSAQLTPPRTALLLIDCQADFAAPDGAMARQGRDVGPARAALANAAALLDGARAAAVMPVFVRLQTQPGDAYDLCVEGTPGADFFGVAPRPGETIVTKRLYSAFSGTGLADLLKSKGIGTLVLAGLTTECCVASSAWAAFEAGFQLVIASDAVAAYEEALHRETLKALLFSGATILSAAQIADHWKKNR